jgi:diguanylate cyclase
MSEGLVSHTASGMIRRIFGKSSETMPAGPGDHPGGGTLTDANPYRMARRELLDKVSDFLVANDLDINSPNFLRTHAAFSGTDLSLARRIADRQIAGEPITQQWLDTIAPPAAEEQDNHAGVDRLVAKLESSIDSFTHTTQRAQAAASHYNTELALHAENFNEAQATSQMLTSLAELTRAMLDRTRQIEDDMKRSEREAVSLRKSLEKAQRDAALDHLTGLPNRRAFEGLFEQEYRAAQKEIEPLCVAICDIDNFKRVNDTHGHDTGDRVIQAVAQVLARVSDERCHVARHGGEEFVMVLRGLTKREALVRLDEARAAMAARRFVNRATDAPIGTITFSGGIADAFGYPDQGSALRAADEALYRAKQSGRNRIELA